MTKSILQGFMLLGAFALAFITLNTIDWKIESRTHELSKKTEKQVGEIILENIRTTETILEDSLIVNSIDSIISRICRRNSIDKSEIRVYVVENDQINAFALPGRQIVVYSGLIANSKNPDAVSGVLAHEIAHIELNHVMKKLGKEIGLSALIALASQNQGGVVLKKILKHLSSTAYDRELETEADNLGVDYLIKARINPEPLADFFVELSDESRDHSDFETFLSTHPDPKDRSKLVLEKTDGLDVTYEPTLHMNTWQVVQASLK